MDTRNGTLDAISFIRRITADGDLSSDEAWLLADFLNRREDCAASWPGNTLVPILAEVWADGELTEGELGALAGALQVIETTWTHAPPSLVKVSEQGSPLHSARNSLNGLTLPFELPRLPIVTEVESSSGDDTYHVDLHNHTCTCPDFRKRRSRIHDLNPSRCCKHLCGALSDNRDSWPEVNPLIESVVESLSDIGKGAPDNGQWYIMGNAAFSFATGPWVNIFTANPGGGMDSYGYNYQERRWSYGSEPVDAEAIATEIHRIKSRS